MADVVVPLPPLWEVVVDNTVWDMAAWDMVAGDTAAGDTVAGDTDTEEGTVHLGRVVVQTFQLIFSW